MRGCHLMALAIFRTYCFLYGRYFAERVVKIQFCDICNAVISNFTRVILFFKSAQVSSSSTIRNSMMDILHFDKKENIQMDTA